MKTEEEEKKEMLRRLFSEFYHKMISHFNSFITEHEAALTAKKKTDQPLVRNPKGEVWWRNKEITKCGNQHVTATYYTTVPDDEDVYGCHRMTQEEAFRPGAMVQKEYENGSIYRGIIGERLYINTFKMPVFCGTKTMLPAVHRNIHPNELTLVEPAPIKGAQHVEEDSDTL